MPASLGALLLLVVSLTASAGQDLTDLPEVTAPGTVSLSAQGLAWLSVTRPGIYRIGIDGPGVLALSRFRTEDGRSDGSDGFDELARAGSPFNAATFDPLLLEPGNSYLLQLAATKRRAISVERIASLDRGAARRNRLRKAAASIFNPATTRLSWLTATPAWRYGRPRPLFGSKRSVRRAARSMSGSAASRSARAALIQS